MAYEKLATPYEDRQSDRYSMRKSFASNQDSMPQIAACTHTAFPSMETEDDSSSNSTPPPCFTCHSVKTDFSHEHGQHIDNSFVLLHKVSLLFEKEDLSDIQLIVGPKVFNVHKLILSSSSDVLRVMLTNPSWPESRTSQVLLKEEPECVAVFEDFLKYLYTGHIHLMHYTVLPVLMLADKYNVCDLRAVCTQYMCDHLVSTVERCHAVSWLQYAYTCAHELLAEKCYQFILWNFHKVVNCTDFVLMETSLLLKFVHSSDLVIPDEFTLFEGVSRWLQHQRSLTLQNDEFTNRNTDYYSTALEMMNAIRFPMFSPVQLSQLDKDPLAEYFTNFFLEKMVLALEYHMGKLMPALDDSEQWQPRNYTNDIWSTTLSIDNFLSLPLHDVRPLFFSSPQSASQADENKCWEWNVDLFPKGIQFQKCIMIGLWRNLEVGGMIYNNIRLVLSTKQPDIRSVEVSILVHGVQDNVQYIKQVVKKQCMFDKDKGIFHFNNIVPYDELNCSNSDYLCGSEGNTFKVTIIIKPVGLEAYEPPLSGDTRCSSFHSDSDTTRIP